MRSLLLILFLAVSVSVYSQKYNLANGEISFFSEAPLENIKAVTSEPRSIFNVETGEIVFSIPINTFQFDKSLMQEHFNERFMESDKYPNATFKGKLVDFDKKAGKQSVTAEGEMKIHGVAKQMTIEGEVNYQEDKILMSSVFPITVADHEIEIPKLLWNNIAEVVEVTVSLEYESL